MTDEPKPDEKDVIGYLNARLEALEVLITSAWAATLSELPIGARESVEIDLTLIAKNWGAPSWTEDQPIAAENEATQKRLVVMRELLGAIRATADRYAEGRRAIHRAMARPAGEA